MSMPVINASDTTRTQAINDLLESIALQETGLSHVINAEGEKIQAAIASKCFSIESIIAVNESVKNTIEVIKDYENVLLDKLNALLEQ